MGIHLKMSTQFSLSDFPVKQKQKKAIVTYDICRAEFSRKTLNIPDTDGHWTFFCAEDSGSRQFQSINCVQCGNYDFHMCENGRPLPYSDRIFCKCETGYLTTGVFPPIIQNNQ
jgi:hypothetical protein